MHRAEHHLLGRPVPRLRVSGRAVLLDPRDDPAERLSGRGVLQLRGGPARGGVHRGGRPVQPAGTHERRDRLPHGELRYVREQLRVMLRREQVHRRQHSVLALDRHVHAVRRERSTGVHVTWNHHGSQAEALSHPASCAREASGGASRRLSLLRARRPTRSLGFALLRVRSRRRRTRHPRRRYRIQLVRTRSNRNAERFKSLIKLGVEKSLDQLRSAESKVLGDVSRESPKSVPSRRASCRGTVTWCCPCSLVVSRMYDRSAVSRRSPTWPRP